MIVRATFRDARPALANVAIIAATVMQLRWQGRLWWCACGGWALWSSDARGAHNSQHLLDPYSFGHVLHGLLFYGLMAILAPRLALRWRLVLTVCLECAWEIFENSAFVVARYRAATVALGYEGDSVGNSVGDILCCALGFWAADRLGFRKSLALFMAIELCLLFWIRDNLTLNIIMLVCPLEAVRVWQSAG